MTVPTLLIPSVALMPLDGCGHELIDGEGGDLACGPGVPGRIDLPDLDLVGRVTDHRVGLAQGKAAVTSVGPGTAGVKAVLPAGERFQARHRHGAQPGDAIGAVAAVAEAGAQGLWDGLVNDKGTGIGGEMNAKVDRLPDLDHAAGIAAGAQGETACDFIIGRGGKVVHYSAGQINTWRVQQGIAGEGTAPRQIHSVLHRVEPVRVHALINQAQTTD